MDEQATTDLKTLKEHRSMWFIPGAILSAGVILAASVFFVRSSHLLGAPAGDIGALNPVTSSDHIIGNPSAPVVVIEYADIDSSYSKSFQKTMEQLMTEYGPNGKVAWVYRHFPLVDEYANSETHAEAAECATSIGTPKTFWSFIDFLQTYAPNDQQFNPDDYDIVIQQLGLNVQRFEDCMTAHTYAERVNNDIANAIDIGASGSPYSIILVHGQKPVPLSGALPYDAMKKILNKAISQAK